MRRSPVMGLTRRRLLQIGGAAAGLGLLDALAIEPRWLDVSHHALGVARLPKALEGFRIAQITDAHLAASGVAPEALAREVATAQVGLVVLTGDIIEAPGELPLAGALCRALTRAGARVVATLGNWEHWGKVPVADLARVYAREGGRLLVNENIRVRGVTVAATDDQVAGSPTWRSTLGELPTDGPRLLLTHSPALLDRSPVAPPQFDLALAGHTHGGQITLVGFTPGVPPGSGRFVAGHYTTPFGPAYVSRGTGTSIVPARFACRPELPVFTLTRA